MFVSFSTTHQRIAPHYRDKNISREEYETECLNLLDMRKVAQRTNVEKLHEACLLCSEHTPEKCHRRLLAKYLQHVRGGIQIVYLIQ